MELKPLKRTENQNQVVFMRERCRGEATAAFWLFDVAVEPQPDRNATVSRLTPPSAADSPAA